MSIGFKLLIKERIIDQHILIKQINNCFKTNIVLEEEQNQNNIIIDEIYSQQGLIFTLVKNKVGPYNIYESDFLNRKFQYKQCVYFDLDKKKDLNKLYLKIFELSCNIMDRYNEEAILATDFTEDVCFFGKEKNIYFNKKISFAKEYINNIEERRLKFIIRED